MAIGDIKQVIMCIYMICTTNIFFKLYLNATKYCVDLEIFTSGKNTFDLKYYKMTISTIKSDCRYLR